MAHYIIFLLKILLNYYLYMGIFFCRISSPPQKIDPLCKREATNTTFTVYLSYLILFLKKIYIYL